MRSIRLAVALVLVPVALAAQQPPTKTAPAKGAPSKGVSTAFAREQEVWNAVKAGDPATFEKLVNGTFTYIDRHGIVGWTAKESKTIGNCPLASLSTEDVHTQQPAAGVVILSYKLNLDQSCNGVKEPSPLYIMSVWQRTASSWRLVAHSETAAEQPKP